LTIKVEATIKVTTDTVQHSEQAKNILENAGLTVDRENSTPLYFVATYKQSLTDLG
jgi:hypothetical protein